MQARTHIFFTDKTTVGASGQATGYPFMSFIIAGKTNSGTGSITGGIDASFDGSTWTQIQSFSIAPTTSGVTAAITMDTAYPYVRARIATISGDNARATISMAYADLSS